MPDFRSDGMVKLAPRVMVWVGMIGASGLLTAGALWVNQPTVCACGSPLRSWVGALGRAQQVTYVETGRFASDRAALEQVTGAMPPQLTRQYRITMGCDGQTAWVQGEHQDSSQPDSLTWWQVLTDRPFARQLPSDYRIVLTVDPKTGSTQSQACVIERVWVGNVPFEPLRLQIQAPRCQGG